ncbi:MAG: hypothetical protein RL531_400 [Actinomycetota bacterium]
MGQQADDRRPSSPIHFRVPTADREPVGHALVDITDPEKVTLVEMDEVAAASAARVGLGLGDALNGMQVSDDLESHGRTKFQRLVLGEIAEYTTQAVYFSTEGKPVLFHVTARATDGPDLRRRYMAVTWIEADVVPAFDAGPDAEVLDLAQLITNGTLADAPVGVALVDARQYVYVTVNHAFAHVLGLPRRELVGASCEIGARADTMDRRTESVLGVLRGDLDSLTVTVPVPDEPSISRLLTVSAVGERTPHARYLVAYINDMPTPTRGLPQPVAPPMVTSPLGGDATAYSYALVDEMWRLQFLLPPAAEWGMEEDKIMGFSVVPGIHPSDLPLLFDAGDRVRSGEVSKVRIRVHYRATVGRYGYFPADCEIARTETMPAGWLSMTYRNAAADPEGSMADRLAAITEPIVEDEPHALPTDVRTAAAVARVAERCGLTAREVEIVRLLVDGYRVTTMTKTLHLSAGTIRNYLSGVFHKVGVHGQAELIEHVRSEADPA